MVQHDVEMRGRWQGQQAAGQRRNTQFAAGRQVTGQRSAGPGRNLQYIGVQRAVVQDRNKGYTAGRGTTTRATVRTTCQRRTGAGKLSVKRRRNRRIKRFCALAMSVALGLGIVMAVQSAQHTFAGFSMELPERAGMNTVIIEEGNISSTAGLPDFTEELQELLEKNGIQVIPVEFDEVMKGFGAIHCCTAFLKRG